MLLGALALSAAAYGATIHLNEYNAVANNEWLDGAGSTKSDTYFGRILANGGDWFELVVVGDGTAGSTVDLRGWEIRIDHDGNTNRGHLKLSNNPYWYNVRAGTILTFIETENAGGQGVDTTTEIHKVDRFDTEGWAWTNIWANDSTYIDTADADHDANFPISDVFSQFVIFRPNGTTVEFGPAGEGVRPTSGVGDDEVFKLETAPSPSILRTSGFYTDGESSSFGAPNRWTEGHQTVAQDFSAFIPEPGTIVLLASGGFALLLGWCRRRRAA